MSALKWSAIIVVVLVAGVFTLRWLTASHTNPRVLAEIAAEPGGERAGIVMALTLPDGRTLPINYLREDNRVYAGADGRWWRTLRDGNAPVTMLIRGETLTGSANVVMDDPTFKADVFSRLRPTVPTWLPDWLNAHLIVIELGETNQ